MERCVHKVLYNYLVSKDLVSPLQSGFVKGDSTNKQRTLLYNDVCKALDDGQVRAVFCDISKAFNRIWHRGLLHKLSTLGISGSLLRFLHIYHFVNNGFHMLVPRHLGHLLTLVYLRDLF